MHNFFLFEFNSWSGISANTISDMARRRSRFRARVALRAKYRVRPAWLIKRLSCRLFMTFLKILRTIQLRKVDKADSMQRCFLSAKPELFNHKQANLKTSSVKVKSKILTTMTQKIDCKLNVLNLQALLREMQFACSWQPHTEDVDTTIRNCQKLIGDSFRQLFLHGNLRRYCKCSRSSG